MFTPSIQQPPPWWQRIEAASSGFHMVGTNAKTALRRRAVFGILTLIHIFGARNELYVYT